jgi:effector-binding domain-containing protein
MIEIPQIVRTGLQLYAFVHLTVPSSEVRNVMGPGLMEVNAALAAQGVEAAGPWFTHHFHVPAATFDFEICVPVAAQIEPTGRVQAGVWPAMQVARTVYSGDYSGLGAGWGEFEQWIAGQGLAAAPDLWERYTVGPESSPDPTEWRTELNRPLL